MEAGADITTLGSVGFAGAANFTVDLGITFQAEQSVFAVQDALSNPGSTAIGLPTLTVEEDPGWTVTDTPSCDHWHAAVESPANWNSIEQVKELLLTPPPPWLVAESKAIRMVLPSLLNSALVSVGSGGSSLGAII